MVQTGSLGQQPLVTNSQWALNVELDVEKKLQAEVLKDRIRIKEFFIDFDKLRKGYVGEAGVIISSFCRLFYYNSVVQNLPWHT